MLIECGCQPETFWELLTSWPHWALEMMLMVIFDGVVGVLVWPFIKKHWAHHKYRDARDKAE